MQLQLHYITQRYTTLTTPHCATTATTTTTASIHCTRLHYTTLIAQHYNYTTLHYTRLHYSTQHYSTLRYTTVHYTNYTTPQLQLQLHYTIYITTTTYNYNSTTLHYNYNYNCTTPHYIQQLWRGDHCNHCSHSKKHSSNHHQWILSAICDSQQPTSPIGFLFLKLLPPPCAVLLVYQCNYGQPAIQGFSMGFSSGFQAPQVDRRSLTLRVHASWNLSCLDQAVPTQWCYNLDMGGFLKWKIP